MPITTCTEYEDAFRALYAAEQAEREPVSQALRQCIDAAQQRFNAVAANPQASPAQIEAARAQMEQEIKECREVAAPKYKAITAKYAPQYEDLKRQARDSLARLGRLIISWEDLQPAAVALQDVSWFDKTPGAEHAPIVTVQSFDDLRHFLEHDRCAYLLLLMVRAEDGALVLGGERKTLSEIVAEWTPTVKMRAPEILYLSGELIGEAPQDTDGFRAMLRAGGLRTQWTAATNPCGATLRFLDFQNNVIDPSIQALAVSNHVSNDPALQGLEIILFEAQATDRSAFRLEVEDSTAGASVEVVLWVRGRAAKPYQLNAKSGSRYRGPFLRLVTDAEDEGSLATSQNILCELGETVVLSYRKPPPGDCEDRHEIGIGRPFGEDNNDHPDHSRHDIRELELNVVVFSGTSTTRLDGNVDAGQTTIWVTGLADARDAGFIKIEDEIISYTSVGPRTFRECVRGAAPAPHADGTLVLYSTTTPAASRAAVVEDLKTVDERFAQSGIRVSRPVNINLGGPEEHGVVLPPDLLGGVISTPRVFDAQNLPTASEMAVFAFKDPDANSIDVFYVKRLVDQDTLDLIRGVAYCSQI